ncbi:MAG: hypothetical protein QOD26_3773, partial [Betaproteobacteria bacterium]|nr:hypothetical protein [Betaproteobacteria bacterium]
AVLLTIVPVQVVLSIGANLSELPHDLWLFSIYQNRQYVPVILVSAYLIWLFAYWKPSKVQITLAAVMGYYAAASFSALALLEVLVGIGLLFFATNRDRWAAGALLAAILSAGAFLTYNLNSPHLRHKYAFGGAGQYATPAGVAEMDKFLFPEGSLAANLPVGLQQRLQGWSAYWKASSHSTGVFLVGHATPPPRSEATSAHNYYLDVLYNFGVFALLPLLGLIAYTGAWLWRARNRMTLPLLGLTFVVAFILILDNNLKVPLRQPYPGIFAFFLWGILLSSLNGTSADTYQNLKAKQ